MIFNETLTQCLAPVDYVPPQAVNNTTISSTGIDMSKNTRAWWKIQAGNLGAAGIVAAQVQSCQYAAFNSAVHNMTGCSITNMATNNTVTTVEVRADQVAYQNPGDKYVRLNITGSGNSLTVGVMGEGGCAPQGPGGTQQVNTSIVVAQVVCST